MPHREQLLRNGFPVSNRHLPSRWTRWAGSLYDLYRRTCEPDIGGCSVQETPLVGMLTVVTRKITNGALRATPRCRVGKRSTTVFSRSDDRTVPSCLMNSAGEYPEDARCRPRHPRQIRGVVSSQRDPRTAQFVHRWKRGPPACGRLLAFQPALKAGIRRLSVGIPKLLPRGRSFGRKCEDRSPGVERDRR